MSGQQIRFLKEKLRREVIAYRHALDNFGGDCGAHMAAVISPAISEAARRVNETAAALKEIDPQFPSSWTPYPEGK